MLEAAIQVRCMYMPVLDNKLCANAKDIKEGKSKYTRSSSLIHECAPLHRKGKLFVSICIPTSELLTMTD